jgi:NAD(P)H-flavin reductase
MALPLSVSASEPMLPRAFRVIDRIEETADTFTLDLASADDGPPATFTPGQFNMVYVYGVGEVPLSISGDPAEPEILTHTIRAVGAVTNALFDLDAGDQVGVRGPYGVGWPMERAGSGKPRCARSGFDRLRISHSRRPLVSGRSPRMEVTVRHERTDHG